MKTTTTILTALLTLTIGCAGEFAVTDPGGDGVIPPDSDSTAGEFFETAVASIVESKCGGCHAGTDPAFYDSADPYGTIMQFRPQLFPNYDSNDVLVRYLSGDAEHAGGQPISNPVSTDERLAVTEWLALEAAAPTDGPDGQNFTATQIWSGCMEYDDWDNEDVSTLWANKNTNEGRCEACHNLGAEGFIASDDELRTFNAITTSPSMMTAYFGTATIDGELRVVVNKTRLENVGRNKLNFQAHPTFDPEGNAMDALDRFYDLTEARRLAGNCGAPRF